MGFFKNIGKVIKKNVSFKNLVKVAGQAANFIPVAGGLVSSAITNAQDAHFAKKEQLEAERQNNLALAQQKALEVQQYTENVSRPIASVSRTITGQIINDTGNAIVQGVSQGGRQFVANTGSQVIDLSLAEWFKKNWWIPVGVFVALLATIKLMQKR